MSYDARDRGAFKTKIYTGPVNIPQYAASVIPYTRVEDVTLEIVALSAGVQISNILLKHDPTGLTSYSTIPVAPGASIKNISLKGSTANVSATVDTGSVQVFWRTGV